MYPVHRRKAKLIVIIPADLKTLTQDGRPTTTFSKTHRTGLSAGDLGKITAKRSEGTSHGEIDYIFIIWELESICIELVCMHNRSFIGKESIIT
jgi:hypothetical protein